MAKVIAKEPPCPVGCYPPEIWKPKPADKDGIVKFYCTKCGRWKGNQGYTKPEAPPPKRKGLK